VCELFCLSSRIATRTTFSLRAFAGHGTPGTISVDGWGVALYDDRDVRLYKEPEPAGDSHWLAFVEGRQLASRLILSQIRHATTGDVSYANTQPFVRELGGRKHVFAHNGQLMFTSAWNTKPSRFRPVGCSDSEMAFCLLLERLAPLWQDDRVPALSDRLDSVVRFAADMRKLGPANFLYADGDALFAHSHRRMQADGTVAPPGLWMLLRRCACDPDSLPAAGVKIENRHEDQQLLLLASVPLSSDSWQALTEGEVIAVKNGRLVEARTSERQRHAINRPPELAATVPHDQTHTPAI
jgi:predicted glutamine amidotransferase